MPYSIPRYSSTLSFSAFPHIACFQLHLLPCSMQQVGLGHHRTSAILPRSCTWRACPCAGSAAQVLLAGKISQAALLSAAAYRDEESFRRTTGIAKCRLVVDKNERNTHVRVPSSCVYICIVATVHGCMDGHAGNMHPAAVFVVK